METHPKIENLLEEVFRHGVYDRRGRVAIERLSQIGAATIPVLVRTLTNPPQSDLHPRDLWESIQDIFCGLARSVPDALINLMEKDHSQASCVIWALGYAKGKRSITILIEALKHEDQHMRWAAAESLIRRRSKRAVNPLVEALRDRSSLVKFTVVQAMKSNRMYRKPEAIEPLRRIRASKTSQKHEPGLCQMAQEVIDMIEKEQGV